MKNYVFAATVVSLVVSLTACKEQPSKSEKSAEEDTSAVTDTVALSEFEATDLTEEMAEELGIDFAASSEDGFAECAPGNLEINRHYSPNPPGERGGEWYLEFETILQCKNPRRWEPAAYLEMNYTANGRWRSVSESDSDGRVFANHSSDREDGCIGRVVIVKYGRRFTQDRGC